MRRIMEEYFPLLTVVDETVNSVSARLDNSPHTVCLTIRYDKLYHFVFSGSLNSNPSEHYEFKNASGTLISTYNTVNQWLQKYL